MGDYTQERMVGLRLAGLGILYSCNWPEGGRADGWGRGVGGRELCSFVYPILWRKAYDALGKNDSLCVSKLLAPVT